VSVEKNSIVIKCGLFREADTELSRKMLLVLLETSVTLNRLWINAHPHTPEIYSSGVRYLEDHKRVWPPSAATEDFCTIPEIISARVGDCDDLAPWRVADLRERYGIKCRPWIRWRDYQGITVYHVLVQYADDRIEDPSKVLGMGSEGGDVRSLVPQRSMPVQQASLFQRGRR